MPALPSAAKVLRIDQFFHLEEDLKAKCRSFWQYLTGPPTVAELNTMAIAVQAAFATDLAPLMNSFYSLVQVIITDLSSPTSAVGEVAGITPGTNTANQLTADLCVLQSNQVARRYRGGHSRIYWPFGSVGQLHDGQTWDPTFIASVGTALGTYETAVAASMTPFGGSAGPVNVSFYEGFSVHTGVTGRARNVSTPRSSAVIDPISEFIVRQGIAVQRKRLLHLA